MEIRLLTKHDAEAWWHLRRLALETDPESFVESVADHEKTTIEDTREKFRRSSGENFVVGMFEAGELAGIAGFYRYQHAHFRHKGHIWGVYVRQESRGRGAAWAILTELLRVAWAIPDLEQITLAVTANQLPAKRLYASLGFRVYGVEPRSLKVGGGYLDDELMIILRP